MQESQKPEPQQVIEFLLILPTDLKGRLTIATVAAALAANTGNISATARALKRDRRWVVKQRKRVIRYLANHILAELQPYDPESRT